MRSIKELLSEIQKSSKNLLLTICDLFLCFCLKRKHESAAPDEQAFPDSSLIEIEKLEQRKRCKQENFQIHHKQR